MHEFNDNAIQILAITVQTLTIIVDGHVGRQLSNSGEQFKLSYTISKRFGSAELDCALVISLLYRPVSLLA